MKQELRFGLDDLLGIAFTLIVVAIGISYGLDVMVDVRDGFTANSLQYNATTNGMTSVSNLSERLPTLATIVVASVILSVLVGFLYMKFAK